MTSDGTHSYTWDARNRLKQIDLGNTASFTYDPFGRRATKSIVGTSTTFLYDGLNPVQEVIGGTNTANSLSGGVDEVFQQTDSAGARSFLTDPLGSTLALVDSTGTLQTQYTFEPFGNTTVGGSATTNSFAYTGRELDATGLYFYRARFYNPSLQRFISEDPMGFAGGVNGYAYAGNNPIDFVDPLGLDKKTPNACSPPTSKFPKTIGVSAGGTAAANHTGTISIVGSATTAVVSLNTGAVGLLANVGAQDVPSAAPPGGPEANGQFAGVGYQFVLSNGQPTQLVGSATSNQISIGLVIVGGTVAYSSYPNGVYKVSFTPWPGLPGAAGLGVFYKLNVPQYTIGLTTGCQ